MRNTAAHIRPATPADWSEVQRLLRAHTLPTEGATEHLGTFLVAEDQGRIVGCIGLEHYGALGLVRSLAVSAQYGGRGLGTELVQTLLAQARQLGVNSLYLLTTTAAEYFPRFGFRRIPRTDLPPALDASAELRGACPASAVAMRHVPVD